VHILFDFISLRSDEKPESFAAESCVKLPLSAIACLFFALLVQT